MREPENRFAEIDSFTKECLMFSEVSGRATSTCLIPRVNTASVHASFPGAGSTSAFCASPGITATDATLSKSLGLGH